jgi:FkbM family methyltransferase
VEFTVGYIDSIRGRLGGRWSVLKEVWSHPINRGSRLLALRDYALWNAVRFSMDARHVVRLPEGLEIILGKKENYGSVVYTHFLSDYAELLFLAHCLRSGDLFADVGANVGLYSVWVAGSTGARVVAFEPNPTTFLALNQNIRLNDLGALIEAHQFAIGDVSGSVAMTAGLGGLDHVVDAQNHDGADIEVIAKTLDEALGERAPFALKIDVEGFESHVLRGAKGVLQHPALKVILIEIQNWTLQRFGTSEQEVLALLRAFGFEVCKYDPFKRALTTSDASLGLNQLLVRDGDRSALSARLVEGRRIPLPGYPQGL